MPSVRFLTTANAELANHRMKTYKHLTTAEPAKREIEEIEMAAHFRAVETNLKEYSMLLTTSFEREELKIVQTHLSNYGAINMKIIELSQQNRYDSAKKIIYASSFEEYTTLCRTIKSLADFNSKRSHVVSHQSDSVFNWSIFFTGLSLIGLIIFVSYFGSAIIKTVFDHLKEMTLSEAKFRAILESSSDANFFLDKDYRILSFNKAAADKALKIYQRVLKNGDSFLNLMPMEMRLGFMANFKKALSGEEIVCELSVKEGNGERWFRRYYYPVRDEFGQIVGVAINSQDITQQKDDERAILSRDTTLSEISFIQSHRVRGPVATLLGLVSLFETSTGESDLNKRIIQDVSATTKKLDSVVREIVSKTYRT
jgi:PAS domain S-box-containing protein